MKKFIANSFEEMCGLAADVVFSEVTLNPKANIGVACNITGAGVYDKMAEMYAAGKVDFSRARFFSMSEVHGKALDDPTSKRAFLNKNLFSRINAKPENIFTPDGGAPDAQAEIDRHMWQLGAMGGYDLLIIEIEGGGGIGANRNTEEFTVMAHCPKMGDSTVMTLGLNMVVAAKRILLLNRGDGIRDMLIKAMTGPVHPSVPASILQFVERVRVYSTFDW